MPLQEVPLDIRPANRLALLAFIGLASALAGCGVSKGDLRTLETQNRILSEQNRSQQAEIANLHEHRRKLEDQIIRVRRELATMPDPVERK